MWLLLRKKVYLQKGTHEIDFMKFGDLFCGEKCWILLLLLESTPRIIQWVSERLIFIFESISSYFNNKRLKLFGVGEYLE